MERKPYTGPLVVDVPTQDVCRLFEEWEPDVLQLVQVGPHPGLNSDIISDYFFQSVASYTAWAIHVVNPLPFYASGSVVLIGDAVSFPIGMC
jgi:hypothetical protein